jgi:hypothetical protein
VTANGFPLVDRLRCLDEVIEIDPYDIPVEDS